MESELQAVAAMLASREKDVSTAQREIDDLREALGLAEANLSASEARFILDDQRHAENAESNAKAEAEAEDKHALLVAEIDRLVLCEAGLQDKLHESALEIGRLSAALEAKEAALSSLERKRGVLEAELDESRGLLQEALSSLAAEKAANELVTEELTNAKSNIQIYTNIRI